MPDILDSVGKCGETGVFQPCKRRPFLRVFVNGYTKSVGETAVADHLLLKFKGSIVQDRRRGETPGRSQVRFRASRRPRRSRDSIKGAAGSVALAGLIDGIFQFASDSALCNLSPAERFNRFFLATALGIIGGTGAAIVFIGVTALGAPVIAAAGAAFGAGLLWNEFAARPLKNEVFATDPRYG